MWQCLRIWSLEYLYCSGIGFFLFYLLLPVSLLASVELVQDSWILLIGMLLG